MHYHISDAIKEPRIIQLESNLYIARFESMKIYSTLYAVENLLKKGLINKNTTLRSKGLSVNLCGLQPFGSVTFGAEEVDDLEIIIAGIGSAIEFRNIKYDCYNSINWLSFEYCLNGTIELTKRYGIFITTQNAMFDHCSRHRTSLCKRCFFPS